MSQAKLYQYAVCPFCWKVRVGLSMKKVNFETIEVHPLNKKEISFSPDWKKVPIWKTTIDEQVNESTDILRKLDESYSQSKIFQDDENEKEWLEWSEKYVSSLPTVIYNGFGNSLKAFDYITKQGNFSFVQKRVIKYSGAGVMQMVAKKIRKRLDIKDPEAHVLNLMQEWSESLPGKFQGGDKPNAADVSVYGYTLSMRDLPSEKLVSMKPKFHAWYQEMSKLAPVAN